MTARAYPGPTKKFPTPTLDNQTTPPCFLLPAYKLLLKHINSAVKTVKACSEGAESVLQAWKLFKEAATQGSYSKFVEYALLLTGFINKRVDDVIIEKKNNQNPWKWSLDPQSSSSKLAMEMSLEQ